MTTLWITLLLMETVGLFEVSGQSACGNITSTAVCRCRNNSDGTWKVNCTGLGLNELPNDLPINTTYLFAGHNKLSEIGNDTLLRLQYLQHIVLDANKLATLPKFPKDIKNIYASYNNIQSIDGVFDGLTSLVKVEMLNTSVQVIKNTTFKDNLHFHHIKMLKNVLEEIQPNTFARLKHLIFIDIRENNLNVIKENTFALHGSSPCQVYLNKANVREIATGSFTNLGKSSDVYLGHNLISSIPSRAFNGSEFISISIEFNRLKHIHPEAFIEVKSLFGLYLQNNLFTEIPLAVYSSKVVFSINLSINSINLSSEHNRSVIAFTTRRMFVIKNNIQSISRHHFSGLETLEMLFLHLNNISYIEDGSFSGTNLTYLYLYGNNLKVITSETLNVNARSLRYLYLFNNPIEVVEYEAYSHLAPNSTVYLDCGALEYIPPKISDNIVARCVTNKTQIEFTFHNVKNKMMWYGIRCVDRSCMLCAQGYYGLLSHEGCYPCPAGGYYQDRLGYVENGNYTSDCKRCPIGTFSLHYGSASIFNCRSCPLGTNTDANAALDACPCLENFHRTYRYGACDPCPSGVDCIGGYQKLRAGYWWSWNFTGYTGPDYLGSLHEYSQFVDNINHPVFEISNPETLNDTVYTGSIPAVHICHRSQSCQGGDIEAKCSEGYSAWFCAECSPNYYKLFNDCHKCQDIKIIIIVTISLILSFVGVCYGLWRLDKRIRGDIQRHDKFLNHLKIAINFYQVLGILSEVNEIHWPDSFQSVGQSLQYLDIVRYVNILSPICIFPGVWNAYTFLYIAIATPFIIIVSSSFIFLVCYIYKRYKQTYSGHHLTDNFISITIVLLYLNYANACSNIMAVGPWSVRTFNVTADGKYLKRVLTSDYSIDIDEESGSKYEINKNIAYASFVYVIGFPLVLILVIYCRYKRHEVVRYEGEQPGTGGLRFFCKQYSSNLWFWEIIDMYSKAILALIANFKDDQASNMSYSLFLTVVLIALHLYLEPMKTKSDQRFQLLTLVFIVVNLSVGAIVDLESAYTVDETILFLHDTIPVVLLLLNLSILFAVFFDLLIKVKEILWWKSTDSHELRNVTSDVDDDGDGENELSPIMPADFESLSVYNPTIHN